MTAPVAGPEVKSVRAMYATLANLVTFSGLPAPAAQRLYTYPDRGPLVSLDFSTRADAQAWADRLGLEAELGRRPVTHHLLFASCRDFDCGWGLSLTGGEDEKP